MQYVYGRPFISIIVVTVRFTTGCVSVRDVGVLEWLNA